MPLPPEDILEEIAPLTAKIAKELTEQGRAQVKDKNFVFPEQKKYPIHDRQHAESALGFSKMHGSPEVQAKVRAAVEKKYPGLSLEKKGMLGFGVSYPVLQDQDWARDNEVAVNVGFPHVVALQASPGPLKGTPFHVGIGLSGPQVGASLKLKRKAEEDEHAEKPRLEKKAGLNDRDYVRAAKNREYDQKINDLLQNVVLTPTGVLSGIGGAMSAGEGNRLGGAVVGIAGGHGTKLLGEELQHSHDPRLRSLGEVLPVVAPFGGSLAGAAYGHLADRVFAPRYPDYYEKQSSAEHEEWLSKQTPEDQYEFAVWDLQHRGGPYTDHELRFMHPSVSKPENTKYLSALRDVAQVHPDADHALLAMRLHMNGTLAPHVESAKTAAAKREKRRPWNVANVRSGKRPMSVDTMLRKEKDGTLNVKLSGVALPPEARQFATNMMGKVLQSGVKGGRLGSGVGALAGGALGVAHGLRKDENGQRHLGRAIGHGLVGAAGGGLVGGVGGGAIGAAKEYIPADREFKQRFVEPLKQQAKQQAQVRADQMEQRLNSMFANADKTWAEAQPLMQRAQQMKVGEALVKIGQFYGPIVPFTDVTDKGAAILAKKNPDHIPSREQVEDQTPKREDGRNFTTTDMPLGTTLNEVAATNQPQERTASVKLGSLMTPQELWVSYGNDPSELLQKEAISLVDMRKGLNAAAAKISPTLAKPVSQVAHQMQHSPNSFVQGVGNVLHHKSQSAAKGAFGILNPVGSAFEMAAGGVGNTTTNALRRVGGRIQNAVAAPNALAQQARAMTPRGRMMNAVQNMGGGMQRTFSQGGAGHNVLTKHFPLAAEIGGAVAGGMLAHAPVGLAGALGKAGLVGVGKVAPVAAAAIEHAPHALGHALEHAAPVFHGAGEALHHGAVDALGTVKQNFMAGSLAPPGMKHAAAGVLDYLASSQGEHHGDLAGLGLMAASSADKLRSQLKHPEDAEKGSLMGGERGRTGADLAGLALMTAPTLASIGKRTGSRFTNAMNLAGLTALAAPTADKLQANIRARREGVDPESKMLMGHKAHALAELGGYGLLAAPVVRDAKHVPLKSTMMTLGGYGTLAGPAVEDLLVHDEDKKFFGGPARSVAELGGLGLLAGGAMTHGH